MNPFSDIRACVFDAYGTLFDVHSAVGRNRERLGQTADGFSALWRQKQLEYTWLRSLMDRHADFGEVTADSLDYVLSVFDIQDQALRADLLASYQELDCYPEVAGVLRELKSRGLLTAILSNGSPSMLDTATRASGIRELFDAVLSVEAVGVYKPHPAVYHLSVDELEVPSGAIAFQSSNAWDIAGAASFGYRTVWVNRFDQQPERLPAHADAVLTDLAGLPALLGLDS